VLPADLASALDRLRDRILMRNGLARGLGPTLAARYKPGVRALFSGESGTGKTLAAHWLATEAGLPLYRVDLSAMTSKWIGETEKNISALLDTAEHGDVLLFFDEADSLFGSRTDVSDSHDRYANAQTNFLLQRIEDYTGVAILATNSRDRFDAAFARRLDMVLEFPLPDSAARRQLWDRHLGRDHAVPDEWLDAIAGSVDLAGGHIRNVVLAAAARARVGERPIEGRDLAAAIGEEYAKLGRTAQPLPRC
jgi:SpoVK/Ycf46/Vps4 family AAA+-type ATPase